MFALSFQAFDPSGPAVIFWIIFSDDAQRSLVMQYSSVNSTGGRLLPWLCRLASFDIKRSSCLTLGFVLFLLLTDQSQVPNQTQPLLHLKEDFICDPRPVRSGTLTVCLHQRDFCRWRQSRPPDISLQTHGGTDRNHHQLRLYLQPFLPPFAKSMRTRCCTDWDLLSPGYWLLWPNPFLGFVVFFNFSVLAVCVENLPFWVYHWFFAVWVWLCSMNCVMCQRAVFTPGVCLSCSLIFFHDAVHKSLSLFLAFSNLFFWHQESQGCDWKVHTAESQSHSSWLNMFTWRAWWRLGALRTHPGCSMCFAPLWP